MMATEASTSTPCSPPFKLGRHTYHTFSQPDLNIAATALQYRFTVVTRDWSDFDKARVPVFNPWERR
jgi:predicted nucleic acid-binding protein